MKILCQRYVKEDATKVRGPVIWQLATETLYYAYPSRRTGHARGKRKDATAAIVLAKRRRGPVCSSLHEIAFRGWTQ